MPGRKVCGWADCNNCCWRHCCSNGPTNRRYSVDSVDFDSSPYHGAPLLIRMVAKVYCFTRLKNLLFSTLPFSASSVKKNLDEKVRKKYRTELCMKKKHLDCSSLIFSV